LFAASQRFGGAGAADLSQGDDSRARDPGIGIGGERGERVDSGLASAFAEAVDESELGVARGLRQGLR